MIKVGVVWRREFKGSKTDVVQCLVVDTERFVRVLDKLMNGQRGVVWFNDNFRDLKQC